MLIGRFLMIIPMLAIAGNLAQKKACAAVAGDVPRDRHRCLRVLLIGVIIIVGALTFFPALSLGPILEHLLIAGRQGVSEAMAKSKSKKSCGTWKIVRRALLDALVKLNPRKMMGNPVMFVVEVGSVITTVLLIRDWGRANFGFNLQITLWLWFTVLFANFAEAMAEGRGKAQADTLRKAKSETIANRLLDDGTTEQVAAPSCARRYGHGVSWAS